MVGQGHKPETRTWEVRRGSYYDEAVCLLRGLSFMWAGVNLAIGATTLTLLLWLPRRLCALTQLVSLAITGAGMALTIDRAVRTARREGFAAERSRAGWPPA